MQQFEYYGPMDIDTHDEDDKPVCICADYIGSTEVAYCKSCLQYTDDIELVATAIPDIPAPILIETPVYQFTAPEFFSLEKEQAA